jgi:hypothetical protein
MRLCWFNRLLLLVVVQMAVTTTANAYIGPGSGLSAIGSVLSVIAAMFLAVAGFVWYPLKRLFKRRKAAMLSQSGDA